MKAKILGILLGTILLALCARSVKGQYVAHDTTYSSQFATAFQSLNHHDSIGDRQAMIDDMMSISWLYTSKVELNKSMEYLEKAQILCQQIGDSARLGNVLLLLADNYKSIGAFNTAFQYYNHADSLFEAAKNTPFHVFTQYCMAYCKENEFEHTKSVAAIDTAIVLIQRQKPMLDSLRPEHRLTIKLIVIRILLSKSTCENARDARNHLYEALQLSTSGKQQAMESVTGIKTYFEINEADALTSLGYLDQAATVINQIDENLINESQLAILYPIKYILQADRQIRQGTGILREKQDTLFP